LPLAGCDTAIVRLAGAEVRHVLGFRLEPGRRVHIGQVVGQGRVERRPVAASHCLEAAVVGAQDVSLDPGQRSRHRCHDILLAGGLSGNRRDPSPPRSRMQRAKEIGQRARRSAVQCPKTLETPLPSWAFSGGIASAPSARETQYASFSSTEEATMVTRTLSISLAVMTIAGSAAMAATLTERLQAERRTVVRVDQAPGRFQCAEHRRWTTVAKADLQDVRPGDIVAVEHAPGKLTHIMVVRTAAEELTSPE